MSSKKNIFWGIVLVLGAAALLVHKLGYLQGIGFWPIVLNVFLVAVLIKAVIRGRGGTILFSVVLLIIVNDRLGYLGNLGFWPIVLNIFLAAILISAVIRGKIGTILFSLAFLVIVNDKLLHLEAITPWPVLGAALLGTIGMKMLFPGAGKHFRGHLVQIGDTRKRGVLSSCSQNGSQMEIENAFGQAVRLISGEVSLVKIENAFGAIQVYFNDACPIEGKVVVDVSDAFGKTEIYVPASWKVIMDIEKVFGNCEECGNVEPGGDVMIHIAGGLAFGNLSIIHV